jgi:hypothetical protein
VNDPIARFIAFVVLIAIFANYAKKAARQARIPAAASTLVLGAVVKWS